MEFLFLLSRILFGGYFLWSGINHFLKGESMAQYTATKGVPAPKLAVYGSGLLIIFSGFGILTGVYVTWAVWALVIFLIPVTFMMHAFWKIEDPNAKMMDMIMFSKNMALLGAALAYLFVQEPWAYSLASFFG